MYCITDFLLNSNLIHYLSNCYHFRLFRKIIWLSSFVFLDFSEIIRISVCFLLFLWSTGMFLKMRLQLWKFIVNCRYVRKIWVISLCTSLLDLGILCLQFVYKFHASDILNVQILVWWRAGSVQKAHICSFSAFVTSSYFLIWIHLDRVNWHSLELINFDYIFV